jgi:hypothetical protein
MSEDEGDIKIHPIEKVLGEKLYNKLFENMERASSINGYSQATTQGKQQTTEVDRSSPILEQLQA